MFPRGINTETPSLAETNDAAKLLRINECCKFSNAPFCAGAEWRRMAHFFGGVFLNFSENDHLQPFFPTPFHKSGDNPLPCAIFVVPLHRNSKTPHYHRTFIAFPSHTRAGVNNKRTWCFLKMQVEF